MISGASDFWNAIAAARDAGASAVHVAEGAPMLMRMPSRELVAVSGGEALTSREVAIIWSVAIDPDEWDRIENAGEGETVGFEPTGGPVTITLFRAGDAWRAVFHL